MSVAISKYLKETWEKIRLWYLRIIEKPILSSSLVLLLLSIPVLGLSLQFYISDFEEMSKQVLAEAHGMLFDIAIIGILIFYLNRNGETRQRIRMYKDEIEDFRLWESEEAAFRTVGNIKRLNRHKISDINLTKCHLERTNLNYVNLKGANLNYAKVSNSFLIESNLKESRLNQVDLENSNLNQADLSNAFASGATMKDAFLIKAIFQKAFLIKTNFEGAFLMEADFRGAYLTEAIFTNANLYKADLRGAVGLTVEQLADAKSVNNVLMDPELLEELKRRRDDLE